jgi:hypothetical protein
MGVFWEGRQYDILLERADGATMPFMIVPHSDRRERVNDFAPVISTTGEAQYAEGVWQPWTQKDWRGGLGQEKWDTDEAARFYEAENVETRLQGKVMLQTAVSTADLHPAAQPVDFAGYIYMRATATYNLRRYQSGVGWGGFGIFDAPVTDMLVYGSYLFLAIGPDHDAQTVNSAGSAGFCGAHRTHWAAWDEKLWGSLGHQIFATTDGSTWESAINVGDSSTVITSMRPFAQRLYIGKEDGLYYYDGADVYQMIDCRNRLWSGNFAEMAEWEGYLYFNILRQIYKYSESAIVDITPAMYGTLDKESYGYGVPKSFVAAPAALYVGFDLAENSYPCVLTYTGEGWHPMWKGVDGQEFHGMGYSPEHDLLLLNNGYTKTRQLPSMSDLPCAPFAATGALITPRFDGNMPIVPKAMKSVTLHTRGCNEAQKITVQYRKDGDEEWTTAGDVTSSPQGEIALAPGAGALEVTSDIQFRFILSTSSPNLTPVLEHIAALWLPRPAAVYAFICSVRLGAPIPLG